MRTRELVYFLIYFLCVKFSHNFHTTGAMILLEPLKTVVELVLYCIASSYHPINKSSKVFL